ncbi:MAG TPA: L-erythro-3,5-diaminohexanoate dehydrogenase [Thermoanaerobaculia bacterium]|nr:L-erythro-3,5-diaminohexanoate dehydrogenase [Thermoanaerobaculia bacterium]
MIVVPHPFGLHRSLDPPGVLPQSARRLDSTPRALENEIAVAVRALNVDSASFRQMRETERSTGETVEQQVLRIVGERGKMQNPVTGSGGIFLGEVREVGARHPAAGNLRPGERIASLVSLSLTPLSIQRIKAVIASSERIELEGTAILFERTLWARLPGDFREEVALAAFDVAGAPAAVLRRAGADQTVVVLGTGKAGLLCLAAAREAVGPAGKVFAVDPSEAASARARGVGDADAVFTIDARDPIAVHSALQEATRSGLADLVVNAVNAPGTEIASVLASKEEGTVLFFGMATSFQAAALGAEGLAHPATLLIGNGYVPGHAEAVLNLLRRRPRLRTAFESLCSLGPP